MAKQNVSLRGPFSAPNPIRTRIKRWAVGPSYDQSNPNTYTRGTDTMNDMTLWSDTSDLASVPTEELLAEIERRGLSAVEAHIQPGPIDFDTFWEGYPRRVGIAKARTAWKALNNTQRRQAIEAIGSHVEMWRMEGRGTSTVPYPSSWLNGHHYLDEVGFVPERPAVGSRNDGSGAIQRRLLGGQS